MPDKDKPLPVNVDIRAKAEAKLSIETRIPEKSSGRFVDAITDILSPYAERRGLKGDQLRLQREDVALQIVMKARDRIVLEAKEYKFIPTKILIPLLEAASLEEPDAIEMQGRWANLLASSATGIKVEPRYVSILKELSRSQADLLEQMAFRNNDPDIIVTDPEFFSVFVRFHDAWLDLDWRFFRRTIQNIIEDYNGRFDEEFFYAIYEQLHQPGCIEVELEAGSLELDPATNIYRPGIDDVDLEILSSLGLITEVCKTIDSNEVRELILMKYYFINQLGVEFLCACRNISYEKYQQQKKIS